MLNPTCTVVDDSGNSVHEVEFKTKMSIASYQVLFCDFPAGFVCYVLCGIFLFVFFVFNLHLSFSSTRCFLYFCCVKELYKQPVHNRY